LQRLGVGESSEEILRSVDKLGKIGREKTRKLLTDNVGENEAEEILGYIGARGSYLETLAVMKEKVGESIEETERLEKLYELAESVGIAERLVLDPSITRGLDYYTGVVFETFLDRLPEIGSICSGGRYDNLASLYTKEVLPGVGASVGLDRLVAALEELGLARKEDRPTEVLVLNLDASLEGEYHRIAQEFRTAGLSAEVYPDNKKLGQQFAYAEKKGIPLGIIRGESEHEEGVVNLRFLETRESVERISVEEAIRRGREALRA
jgi:histidyl-tRNA synthetase